MLQKKKEYIKKRENKKKQQEQKNIRKRRKKQKKGVYEKYLKRLFDIVCAFIAILLFSPVMLVTAVLVGIKLGSPIIFTQKRPGLHGKLFKLYKFRSMSDARDKNGKLLSDEERLGTFGKSLRATSLDELPELINILKGDMSIVGPRPLLLRDMIFMTKKQKKRYEVRQGLTGLAQVKGRNAIDWEKKLELDLKYIEKISFLGDIKIIFQTIITAFIKKEGITEAEMATAMDYGDYLLINKKVKQEEYLKKQKEVEAYFNEY